MKFSIPLNKIEWKGFGPQHCEWRHFIERLGKDESSSDSIPLEMLLESFPTAELACHCVEAIPEAESDARLFCCDIAELLAVQIATHTPDDTGFREAIGIARRVAYEIESPATLGAIYDRAAESVVNYKLKVGIEPSSDSDCCLRGVDLAFLSPVAREAVWNARLGRVGNRNNLHNMFKFHFCTP